MNVYQVILIILVAAIGGGLIGGLIAIRQNWKTAQRIDSASRQSVLDQFWKDEIKRINPNILYLISGASFEKESLWQIHLEALNLMKMYRFLDYKSATSIMRDFCKNGLTAENVVFQ